FSTIADKIPDLKSQTNQFSEFVVATPLSDELSDVRADPELLQSLADRSAAKNSKPKVYTPDNAREILEKLERKDEETAKAPSIALWEWWPTLVLILGLL